jgi:hypothetical protein
MVITVNPLEKKFMQVRRLHDVNLRKLISQARALGDLGERDMGY